MGAGGISQKLIALANACVGWMRAISAFTPQIMMERRVDIMTAVVSSIHAVKENFAAMVVWSICIFVLVALGFAAGAAGFIIIMPLLSYASWHGYIAVIKTKKPRGYE